MAVRAAEKTCQLRYHSTAKIAPKNNAPNASPFDTAKRVLRNIARLSRTTAGKTPSDTTMTRAGAYGHGIFPVGANTLR